MPELLDRPTYEEDFHAWALDQARRLRAMGKLRANEPLDWDLLAEEIEDLGKSERFACESFVEQIIAHLLKLEHSVDPSPRGHWRTEIAAARVNLMKKVTPTIRRHLERTLEERYADARRLLEGGLGSGRPKAWAGVPTKCPYSYEQIADDWWPEGTG
jgi:hypothetical protein